MKKNTSKSKTASKKTTTKKTASKKTTVKKTTAKKVAAKKTAASVKAETKKNAAVATYTKTSEYLTDAEVEHYKQLLLEKRLELIGDVSSIEGEALRKSRIDASGDLSSMPIHMADIGTDNYEQEFALNLLDSERKILSDIHEALEKIEEGTYGICEVTARGISKARLEARPWSRYCVAYAKLIEKGIVREGEDVPEGIEF